MAASWQAAARWGWAALPLPRQRCSARSGAVALGTRACVHAYDCLTDQELHELFDDASLAPCEHASDGLRWGKAGEIWAVPHAWCRRWCLAAGPAAGPSRDAGRPPSPDVDHRLGGVCVRRRALRWCSPPSCKPSRWPGPAKPRRPAERYLRPDPERGSSCRGSDKLPRARGRPHRPANNAASAARRALQEAAVAMGLLQRAKRLASRLLGRGGAAAATGEPRPAAGCLRMPLLTVHYGCSVHGHTPHTITASHG